MRLNLINYSTILNSRCELCDILQRATLQTPNVLRREQCHNISILKDGLKGTKLLKTESLLPSELLALRHGMRYDAKGH